MRLAIPMARETSNENINQGNAYEHEYECQSRPIGVAHRRYPYPGGPPPAQLYRCYIFDCDRLDRAVWNKRLAPQVMASTDLRSDLSTT